jgi:hypothetical protein
VFTTLKVGRQAGLTILLAAPLLFGQQNPSTPNLAAAHEFPVTLEQKVVAGTTPAGTQIKAKLVSATLVSGVVIPRGATLFGEVVESSAKSASSPSRLALRVDSAEWKNGSSPIKVYLTAWYYPMAGMPNQDLSYQPADAAQSKKNWNGAGTYPDPNNPASRPFPGGDQSTNAGSGAAPSPSSAISTHRVLMNNVDSIINADGSVTLTSMHSNIKLDKLTTYVLATADLIPKK